MTSMPRAACVALWLNAWLRASATPDDVLDALGLDLHHVFVGIDPLDPERTLGAAEALGSIRRRTGGVSLALTAPGDPAGLGGPASFNTIAMEAGQALLLRGTALGVVPVVVGGAIEWRCLPAHLPVPMDPREARHNLHSALREVTEELVRMEITSWNSDIPDLLMNRAGHIKTPITLSSADAATVQSSALCLAVVDAAREIEPSAIGATERGRFEAGMRRLDAAARHALVAVCSSGTGSDNLASP